MAGYDDRDGQIWMDGKLIPWRDANVHILTHALHYASSVFEGERCYNGRIFRGVEHSERLKRSAEMLDFEIPWTVEEIEAAKYAMLKANGWSDADLLATFDYVRVARGARLNARRCLPIAQALAAGAPTDPLLIE